MKNFYFFLKKLFEKVFELPRLHALRFFTNKWSYLFIYITYANKSYISKFNITLSIFTKILKKISYKMESQYLDQLLKFSKKTSVHLGVKYFLLNLRNIYSKTFINCVFKEMLTFFSYDGSFSKSIANSTILKVYYSHKLKSFLDTVKL